MKLRDSTGPEAVTQVISISWMCAKLIQQIFFFSFHMTPPHAGLLLSVRFFLKICVVWNKNKLIFKVGLCIFRTNADSQWNPVYNVFHRIFVVEMKWFVCSTVNVILTRQTCGQRSSRAAESKRRALGNCFSERICYKFLISKCRGVWDLGLCTTLGLALGEPQRSCDFWKKTCFNAGKIRFCHCAAVPQTQVPKLCTDLDLSILYILILGTYNKFARKKKFLALCVCFPQLCSSAGRRFAASRSRVQNYWWIFSFPQQKFRWNAL